MINTREAEEREKDLREFTKMLDEMGEIIVSPGQRLVGDKTKTIYTHNIPEIHKVIFNGPATIVLWSDDTKTVVKCGDHDIFDQEKGLAIAIVKKAMGNRGNYYEIFKKWLPEDLMFTSKSLDNI